MNIRLRKKETFIKEATPLVLPEYIELGIPSNQREDVTEHFIINYLNSCSQSELNILSEKINQLNEIQVTLSRITDIEEEPTDEEFVLYIIQDTKLADNELIKPFLISKELREKIFLPENKFSHISRKYGNFIKHIDFLIYLLKIFFKKAISLSDEEFETFLKKHIAYQINYNNEYLFAFNFELLLQSKCSSIHVLNLTTFVTSVFGINYEPTSSSFILKENNGLLKYRLSRKDSKILIGLHEEYISSLNFTYDKNSEKIAEYTKLCEKSFLIVKNNIKKLLAKKDEPKQCTICEFKFQKDKDWKYKHCPNCEELAKFIFKLKNNSIDIKNIRRHLRQEDGAWIYCHNLLNKKNISKAELYKLTELVKSTFPKQFEPVL